MPPICCGGHLVHGYAELDVFAAGLVGVDAGEERGGRAGVVAAAVAMGAGVLLGKPAEDVEVGLEVLQRGELGVSS